MSDRTKNIMAWGVAQQRPSLAKQLIERTELSEITVVDMLRAAPAELDFNAGPILHAIAAPQKPETRASMSASDRDLLLQSEEAKRRPRLARHLAEKTGFSAAEAIALLRTCPVEPPSLAERMADQPSFGGMPEPQLSGREATAKTWEDAYARVNKQYGRR